MKELLLVCLLADGQSMYRCCCSKVLRTKSSCGAVSAQKGQENFSSFFLMLLFCCCLTAPNNSGIMHTASKQATKHGVSIKSHKTEKFHFKESLQTTTTTTTTTRVSHQIFMNYNGNARNSNQHFLRLRRRCCRLSLCCRGMLL